MGEGRIMVRFRKPVVASVIVGSLLFGAAAGPAAAATAAAAAEKNASQLTLLEETIVSAGVKQRVYSWKRTKSGKEITTNVRVIIADLQNPNVKLDVMTGREGKFTQKSSVQNMAKQTGAIAGINGDFFDMGAEGAPMGPQIAGGTLMATPTAQLTGMYAFGITNNNKPIIETFTFEGTVRAANGQTFALSGMNRTYGWINNVHSHGNAIHMYTSAWGSTSRANDGATSPTEVMVVNGVVTQIALNGTIDSVASENGYILRAAGKGAEFIAANVKVGDAIDASITLKPVNPNLTYSQNDLKMLIGGHTMLVIDGVAASYTRDVSGIGANGNTARSAVGFTKDERYVYLVAADHAAGSTGPTLPDFQQLLINLGLWRAVNLDGGGSTTLVARPLGDFEAALVNVPKDGSQRLIVNGLGVFATAAPAALKDFIVQGPNLLWKGQSASYSVKAYDVNYNPLDPATLETAVQFKTEGNSLKVNPDPSAAGPIVASAGGTGSVIAYSGKVSEAYEVEVLDSSAIQRLDISPETSPGSWQQGESVKLQLKATLKDGRVGTIPAELVQWQQFDMNAAIANNTLTLDGFKQGAKTAMLLARYDGFSTPLAVPVPQEAAITDFNNLPWTISAETYPAMAIGEVTLVGTDNKAARLAYDFSAGDGATDLAAYITFNGQEGLPLLSAGNGSVQPQAFKLDVFGDGRGGWLRAEFTDAQGNLQRKTLADNIDWTGWRTLAIDTGDFQPAALKRIYIVSKDPLEGEITIDNLSLLYPPAAAESAGKTIQLTIGKKDVAVGGEPRQLDVAPLIDQERTFVPVRFVVDAMGGNIDWNAADKKVTIRKDGHFIELWVGQTEMIADGARTPSDVPPILHSNRTMLPLRFVSEQLGMKVAWDPATKGITIQE